MYEITVNNTTPFSVTKTTDSHNVEQILLDHKPADWSCEQLPDGSFSILYKNKSYTGRLLEFRKEEKTMRLLVSGQEYEIQIKEPIDKLLQSMGLNNTLQHKINQIKSPMPGMVLDILVRPGQKLAKGDPVLVLEAMKMENVFKAPEDSVVKEIKVKEKTVVEKGQVLIALE